MVNHELIELCRTLVAAIQESNTFDSKQLRRLILHIVPQLMVEIDILGGMLEEVLSRKPEAPVPVIVEAKIEKAAKAAVKSRPRPKKKRGRK
ncbi:hypothetical protein EBZ80_11860 [bacterium]|nr:hypothetical protein [bacterium]